MPETLRRQAASSGGRLPFLVIEVSVCGAQVEEELTELGLSKEAMDGIVAATRIGTLEELQQLLGEGNEASQELQQLFDIAEGYGIADYLQLDTSCVRGLAYYTGEAAAQALPEVSSTLIPADLAESALAAMPSLRAPAASRC